MLKILNFFREKFRFPLQKKKKKLLKTSLTLVSKKVDEFEQFSGAEQTERPLSIYWTVSSRSHPSVRRDPACCHFHFFSSVLSKPLRLDP